MKKKMKKIITLQLKSLCRKQNEMHLEINGELRE